jgi:hypothetical protein
MSVVYQQNQQQTLAQSNMSHEDHMRKKCMLEAWKAYKGEFKPPLKVEKDDPDDNVISNRCAAIADKSVSFLFGETIKIEASDETSEPDTATQEFLDGIWGDDDEKMTLLCKIALNGSVCGQTFVKLIPPQDSSPYPRIVVLNSCLIRIVTDPDDCETIYAYIIEYPMQGDIQKRQIIARVDPNGDTSTLGSTLDDTWTITNYVRKGQTGTWAQTGEQELWAYPFAPILTCQNLPNPNESWGIPDVTDVLIKQNKVLNFIQSNISRILYYHAHPKTIATGARLEEVKTGPGDVTILPSPESKVFNLEMTSDLQSSRNFAADLRADMDEESRVPAVALGRLAEMPRGDVSGIALQLMFQPLIEKTTLKRRLYGELIREISRAALVLGGKISVEEFEDYPIEIHWQNLLPVDDQKEAQTALILKQLGVSDDTLLRRLGFDPEDEAKKSETEDKKKMDKMKQMGMVPPPQDQQSGQQQNTQQSTPMEQKG